MGLYRKLPVAIEARQWKGDNLREILDFTGKHPKWEEWFLDFDHYEDHVRSDGNRFKIITPDVTLIAEPGDWIIKGVWGEFYPCKAGIFEATYEPA